MTGQSGSSEELAEGTPALSLAYYKRRQAIHILVTDVFPVLTALAVVLIWPVLRPTILDIWLGVLMWWISCIGITVGFHRLFAHGAFKASPAAKRILGAAGSMAAGGPLIAWVATHRKHHQASDREGDPHSPNLLGAGFGGRLRGLFHAQAGWMYGHDLPSPLRHARDLLEDPVAVRINRHYLRYVLAGVLAPGALALALTADPVAGLRALIWAGYVRIFLMHQVISSVNSICHVAGSRPFDTGDFSANNAWLAIPTVGESWHNNHHRYPRSAYLGLSWWQVDPGAWVVTLLRRAGLIWDVNDARVRGRAGEGTR